MQANLIPLISLAEVSLASPVIEILLAALTVLLLDLYLKEEEKGVLTWISLLGLAIAGAMSFVFWPTGEGIFYDSMRVDGFSLFFTTLLLGTAALTLLSSVHFLKESNIHHGEFHSLILFSTLGMILMATANDLIFFFLALETMSIAVYVLTGMWRQRNEAGEAAMKYFLNGAFASGFLLYGIALIYGATGSTNLSRIASSLTQSTVQGDLLLTTGAILFLIGLAFKVAAVPFHFWAPDVYEGAPTPITGFMAVAVKAAAFAGWTRILMHQLAPIEGQWSFVLWAMAILTMTVGNVFALAQSSVKRMLAYSSIAHAGYLLIGVAAGNEVGGSAVLFYLVVYTLMTLGAFGVLMALKEKEKDNELYRHFAGIGFRHPGLGIAMSIFMLSLAGFPPFGGFTGKFHLFRSAIEADHTLLAIIGVLNSLLSVTYYLRVIVMMYMEEGTGEAKPFTHCPYLYAAIAATAIGTIWLGIAPGLPLELSRISFISLR